jgi:hypothetical protein
MLLGGGLVEGHIGMLLVSVMVGEAFFVSERWAFESA